MTTTSRNPTRANPRRRALAVLTVVLGLGTAPAAALVAPTTGTATLAGSVSALCERCTL